MKKIISILLVAAMLFTLSPVVFANEGDLDKLTENVTKDELVEDKKLDDDTKVEPVAFDIWINGVQLSSDVFQIKDVDDDKVIATYSSSDNVLTLTDAALLGGVVDGVLTGIVSKLDSLTINVNGSCAVTLVGNNDDETYTTICGISGSNITLVFAEGSTLSISTTKNNKTSAAAFDNNPVLTNGRFKDPGVFNSENAELEYYIDTATTITYDANTVTLDNDGGTPLPSSVPVAVGAPMPQLSESILPIKKGYIFGGYYTQKNGAGDQYYNADGSAVQGRVRGESLNTLYAKWTAVSYTIDYDWNGGVEKTNPTETDYGNVVKVEETSKVGYIFLGWTVLDADYDTAMYGDTETAVNIPITSDKMICDPNTTAYLYFSNLATTDDATVTLKAMFEPIIYDIEYDYDGGEKGGDEESSAVYDFPFGVAAPKKANYKFAGWKLLDEEGYDADYDSAMYGKSGTSVTTKITGSDVVCIGTSAKSAVYFKNLTTTDEGKVKLKATWTNYTVNVQSTSTTGGTATFSLTGSKSESGTLSSTAQSISLISSDTLTITATPSAGYYAKIYTNKDSRGVYKYFKSSESKGSKIEYTLSTEDIEAEITVLVLYTTNPITGDSFDPMLWVIAMASATAGAAITIAKKKAHK